MSESTEVQQPFLAQLAAQCWTVIDQGTRLPQDAAPSLHSSVGLRWLPGVFRKTVVAIKKLADGPDKSRPWLTERQLVQCTRAPQGQYSSRCCLRALNR